MFFFFHSVINLNKSTSLTSKCYKITLEVKKTGYEKNSEIKLQQILNNFKRRLETKEVFSAKSVRLLSIEQTLASVETVC